VTPPHLEPLDLDGHNNVANGEHHVKTGQQKMMTPKISKERENLAEIS